MKHVYVIPEPHIWDKSFENRWSYVNEISGYLNEIISRIASESGEKIIIFPGDVFHRSYKSLSGLIDSINLFSRLNDITDGNVYSCVGNHELTYSSNNPFWMMCHDSTDRFGSFHSLSGYGTVSPGIKVADSLAVGKTLFVFGHYGRTDFGEDYSSFSNIVYISHNSISAKEIMDDLVLSYHRNIKPEYLNVQDIRSKGSIPLSDKVSHVFVGHMHSAYGKYTVEECIQGVDMHFDLLNLGSLGRTSITEIDDADLTRTIPHFIFSEDGSYTYEPFDIKLQERASLVNEDKVTASHALAEKRKPIETLKKTNVFGSDPKERITDWLSNDLQSLNIFFSIYNNEPLPEIQDLVNEAMQMD